MPVKRWLEILEAISLKLRLGILFSALLGLSVVGSYFVIISQHRLAVRESDFAVSEQAELESTFRLRELLSEIENTGDPKNQQESVQTFEILLHGFSSQNPPAEELDLLRSLSSKFDHYMNLRSSSQITPSARRESYEEVAATVQALVARRQQVSYRMSDRLRSEQEHAVKLGLLVLTVFLGALIVVGFLIIAFVTKPLSKLALTLDSVNIEDDLNFDLPSMEGTSPEIRRVVWSFEEIIKRLRAYREVNVRRLLIEKRRADIIAASISDGIFLLRNDEILYVNPVGEKILSLPQGRPWKGLNVNASSVQMDRQNGIRAIQKSIYRTLPVELELQVEDNRTLHFLLHAYPISEEVIEQVAHTFDGAMEQLLDRWQANILVIAQDVTLVKEGQEAKGHFIATLSHEVKTPVTSLTMATRLLLKTIDEIPGQTQRSLIKTCAEDVDRLRGLIENLLSVSKFDALTQKLDLQHINFVRLLRQSVQSFQALAFERGIEIITQGIVGKPAITVAMDATKISWALSNLMTNALRHAPRGGRVQVSIALMDEAVEVRIQDNGPGMDKVRQDKVFDKFNPFYDIRVARSGSVGMGMAIAREIIVAHGGRIWVDSEPGQGAEFGFILPLKQGSGIVVAGADPKTVTNMKGDYCVTSARS